MNMDQVCNSFNTSPSKQQLWETILTVKSFIVWHMHIFSYFCVSVLIRLQKTHGPQETSVKLLWHSFWHLEEASDLQGSVGWKGCIPLPRCYNSERIQPSTDCIIKWIEKLINMNDYVRLIRVGFKGYREG